MAKSCAIIPKVRNKKGEIVDSKLYKSLLSFTGNNRPRTNRLYLTTKSEEFIQNVQPNLTLDDNGEPTIESLFEKANLSSKINDLEVTEKLNKDIGFYKKGSKEINSIPNTRSNYRELMQTAKKFNETSSFKKDFIADVFNVTAKDGSNQIVVRVEKRNAENVAREKQNSYNEALNNKLETILNQHGVSVGALTRLEERLGIDGVTDFEKAKTAANGLIELIRIANGERGQKALPEEFAHFAIEAMGNSPFISRLLNYIGNNNLVGEILGEDYEHYVVAYKGDESQLIKEAAGKLLAKHLLQAEQMGQKPYRNILQKVIDAIKNFFKKFNASDIQKAMMEADRDFSKLASDILSGDVEMNISNINTSDKMYRLASQISRDQKLLQDIIDNEIKRLKIYDSRNPNSNFSTNQRLYIDTLELNLVKAQELQGIVAFVDNALTTMQSLDERLTKLSIDKSLTLNQKASTLRDVRNYIFSYKNIIEEIRKAALEDAELTDNGYVDIKNTIDKISICLNDLYIKYDKMAMPLFVEFLKPFVGNSLTVPFGEYKGKTYTVEELMKVADRDISFFDRWLDSMADSSDPILKLFDKAVKRSKENARLRTLEIQKELTALTLELEEAGYDNTDWMFEKDENGNLSGRYISEINYALYKEEKKKMLERLYQKYGENPKGQNAVQFDVERQHWYLNNTELVDRVRVPKKSIYRNKVFDNLSQAQKDYYKKVMEIKATLDSFLPLNYTYLTNAVKIRKDLLERVKNSDGVGSATGQIWENIKDKFIRRTDDTDFGTKPILMDFENNEVQTLPVYYTRMKEGENPNDLSTDIVSTLTAYAAMANDYDEMSKVINVLEVGRDLVKEREVAQTAGDKTLKEKFKTVGRTFERTFTKRNDATRIVQKLNDFFSMQVYGRYIADEGTFGHSKLDKAKTADQINSITSLNSIALSILSGTSNVATGRVMMRIETFCKEYFGVSDSLIADKEYAASLPEFLGEIGSRIKTSKLGLWNELFNVLQEYEQDVKEVNFDRKNIFSKAFDTKTLFFTQNVGEHWMQTRTSLALANTYKMKAPDGTIVSLWDAMEVVPANGKDINKGGKLQLKKGYTKADGSAFTKEDIIAFSRKSASINQSMHGIYNKADRAALQRLALGRMAFLFRKWIPKAIDRRFQGVTYNYDTESWTEGYYRTTGRFLWQLITDLRSAQFHVAANWESLTPTEKANIKRAITELSHFGILTLALGIYDMLDDGDDKDRPWILKMAEYQARRLKTEIGVMIPGRPMILEGWRIIKSPAAGINTIEDTLGLIQLLNPYNYTDELQSGRYKGHSTAYKTFFESPLVPISRTINRGLHPEEGIQFFKTTF